MALIKLFKPYVSWKARWNALKVLSGTQLAEGPMVKRFEQEFGAKFGLKNVVALNSGTSALELAYELAGINPGDEVITPVLTCTATNIPLIHRGAKIVFADIDYDLNINVRDVINKITPQTKAIVFVHFGGNNRGLMELVSLCREKSIILIEDAAQAVGSNYWGKGDYTCVSLQAIKTITSGDGGFLICRHAEDDTKARRLRWFGYDREAKQKNEDIDLAEAGYKYHMNDVTAAIGLGNLAVIDKVLKHKRKLMAIYQQYYLEPNIWMTAGFTNHYNALKVAYRAAGIEIGQHHYRNDKYTLFKKFKNHCPVMDQLEGKYFFVPNHYHVTESQAHKIGRINYKNNTYR